MFVGLFAKKIGMTQIFDNSGTIIPVSLLQAEKCQVSQIKIKSIDGYDAIQIACSSVNSNKISKPQIGHLKTSGEHSFNRLGEFRVTNPEVFTLGQNITVESFTQGQKVSVIGKSIGKGFTGNQKRHNFSRGPMTHGSKNHRLPGSIGACSTPGRVHRGKKMAGHLGDKSVTIKSSEILFINIREQILVLKGSLPGKTNSSFLKVQLKN